MSCVLRFELPRSVGYVDRMLFRERLTPPPLWWVLGGLVAATFPIAVLFYLGPVWALATAAVAMLC